MNINCENFGAMLDRLCPMHVLIDSDGGIFRVGPTLQKLRPDQPMPGRRLLDQFDLTRPRPAGGLGALLAVPSRLSLQFRDAPRTALKGMSVPAQGGAVVNLSFGISLLEAVRDYALTSADFPPTDLTIEMLYLIEAKSAAMEASRLLNQRLQGAMVAAEEQAFTDTLTGLKNRRAMDHILTRLTGAGATFSLMQLDLDCFKAVNDTMGHAAGDHVLQRVARVMVDETREGDTVARVGGDEFVLIFDRLTDPALLAGIAQRLIQRLEQPIPFAAHQLRVSASIGIATAGGRDAPEPARLLHRADLALYAAKRGGRACHRFYAPDMEDDGMPG